MARCAGGSLSEELWTRKSINIIGCALVVVAQNIALFAEGNDETVKSRRTG